MMRLMGVTHVLQAKSTFPSQVPFQPLAPVEPLDLPGVTEVYDGPDARVYRLEDAVPRAFVVNAQRVVDGEDAALDAIASPSFDARKVAITESRLPGLPSRRGRPAAPTTRAS